MSEPICATNSKSCHGLRFLRVAGMLCFGMIAAVAFWELAGVAFDDHFKQKRNEDICSKVSPDGQDEHARCLENGLRYACRLHHSDDIYALADCYNSHIHIFDRFLSQYRYSARVGKNE